MPSLTERLLSRLGYQRFQPYTPEQIAAMWSNTLGVSYMPKTTLSNPQEPIEQGFESLVVNAYAANPVVFACINARVQLFAEARFQFQTLEKGMPGKLFSNPTLSILETPWPNGTTAKLLKDMLLDADLAGNSFVLREANGLRRLRPDWVTIIAGNPRSGASTWDLDTEVLGYGYQPDGPAGGKQKVFLTVEEVAHFKTTHDPLRRFAGIPWLLSTIKDLSADQAGTTHKLKYYENAATPNMAIQHPETMTRAQAQDWEDLFHRNKEGKDNAYKTLFLGGGATVIPIGSSLEQADFSDVQSGGELRIASAAGVPPIMIGIKGGLDAATYSNYGQARRAFADLTVRGLWRDVCGALQTIVPAPTGTRLWYSDAGISFLQEDVKDAADIQSAQAATIRTLTDAGFDAATIIDAVVAGDFNKLKHTGLFSVQLQPPGTTTKPEPALAPANEPASKPLLLNSAGTSGEIRCVGCDKLLAEMATAPYRMTCSRCKQVTASANISGNTSTSAPVASVAITTT